MSDESARPTKLDHAEIERRIRALERQALEARLHGRPRESQVSALGRASQRRGIAESSAGALFSLLVGIALIGGGLLVFLSRVVVWSGFWMMGGQPPLVILLVSFVIGVGLTLGGGRVLRYLGIVLIALSVVAILGVSASIVRLMFLPTPLFTVLGMLALVGLGVGLMVRGVRRL